MQELYVLNMHFILNIHFHNLQCLLFILITLYVESCSKHPAFSDSPSISCVLFKLIKSGFAYEWCMKDKKLTETDRCFIRICPLMKISQFHMHRSHLGSALYVYSTLYGNAGIDMVFSVYWVPLQRIIAWGQNLIYS